MPLTEHQERIARLLASNRSPDSYLAGGAALYVEPNSSRYSNDLDYFQDSEERVASAFAADRESLEKEDYSLSILLNQPGFIRALVERTADGQKQSTKVEWARDSAWRFLPPVKHAVSGYQLHPVDLAVNKLLALVGRDEPRDFLDTIEAHQSILSLGAMCWAAAGKDPGFTPLSLLELLRRRGVYHREDFARLMLREQPDLVELKITWLEALSEAEAFIRSRPSEDMGCLYYSPSRRAFVGSSEELEGKTDAQPHHGRPGGVMPRVVE